MSYDPRQYPPQHPGQPYPPQPYPPVAPRRTEPTAILGLVFAFVFWPAGLVLSIIGMGKTKREGTDGRGLAIGGLVVSLLSLVGTVAAILALVVFGRAAERAIDEFSETQVHTTSGTGTRSDPLALDGGGVTFSSMGDPDWTVDVVAVDWDVDEAVRTADEFAETPDAGSHFVKVEVELTKEGTDAGTPWTELDLSYVTADGVTIESEPGTGLEDDFMDLGEMYGDARATASIVFEIPEADARTGAWSVEALFGDEVFFAAE
ncbi:DUF4190 domain-containing protein [Cellulomonas gilvus]|uniref:DUF4190 domain-containing protein n=1 Tax=Cellulomonas gilvus (strain ATCC 13127 / NRRL B-14078) TaxID=593907 RepID=F8A2B9_CELGA|nr:DUF4190 domain-containing protein [Cellulomonas gilvus]AEI11776.1 hypothetical protein Celgi_1257 [Cellulomonas gilvus ATCC 13127]